MSTTANRKTTRNSAAAGTSDGFPRRFVAPLLLGAALNPVNSSLIATALVPISHALGIPAGRTALLVSALYLACSVAQPTAGKLAEEIGPRRVLLAGTVLVLLGGVLGGVSNGLAELVVARVVIGIGTSTGYPAAMLMVRRRATDVGLGQPPGGVLAGLAIVGLALMAVGPTAGGLLVGWLGWRSTFLVNVPVAVITLAMTTLWLPADRAGGHAPAVSKHAFRRILRRIDLVGIVGFAGVLTCLLLFLMALPTAHWVLLAAAVALGTALIAWELRAATPFLDVRRLVSNAALSGTYLRTFFTMLASYAIMYGLTQWLESARGYSPTQAGLLMVPLGVSAAVASTQVSRRGRVRGSLLASAVALLIGAAALTVLTSSTDPIVLVLVSLLFGITLGAGISAGQTALYLQAPPEQVGTAAGLLRTFTYLGSIASSTMTGLIFRHQVDDHGLHIMGMLLLAVGLASLLLVVADRSLRPPR
jgi:MFS family permease